MGIGKVQMSYYLLKDLLCLSSSDNVIDIQRYDRDTFHLWVESPDIKGDSEEGLLISEVKTVQTHFKPHKDPHCATEDPDPT